LKNKRIYHKTDSQIADEQRIIDETCKNPQHFEKLYDKYYEAIYRFVFKRLEEKQDAYDVTAQVFLKALQNLPRYKHMGLPFSSWLFRIAKSEVYQFLRDNNKIRVIDIESTQLNDLQEETGYEEREMLLQCLEQILPELSNNELLLLEMRYFEKKSFKEVSEILNVSENNAKVKMHRIIEKLKIKLDNIQKSL
jgi:RNA polymerase sigma-70 factor (ECF subfamily)